jgi:hypothetical protein
MIGAKIEAVFRRGFRRDHPTLRLEHVRQHVFELRLAFADHRHVMGPADDRQRVDRNISHRLVQRKRRFGSVILRTE